MSWDITKYKICIELQEPLLGTVPATKSIWVDHVATKLGKGMKRDGKSPEEIEEELEKTLEGVADRDIVTQGLTTFYKNNRGYYVRDFFIKGHLKEAGRVMKEHGNTKQLRSKVVQYLFVRPRNIYVAKPTTTLDIVERPLRAQTAQGERICIARSEAIPEGTTLEYNVHVLNDVIKKSCLSELLQYGEYMGLGAWRGSGAGRFSVVSFEEE
jgi:hypothetical protein